MVEAYVLVTVGIGKVHDVVEELKSLDCVKYIDAVTGPYDVITRIQARDLGELTKTVIQQLHKIDGVIDTTTAIVIDL
ncbi:Lrp/AsnC family transcriptional regulator [archaeon]|nr:MAG: Lrp/AsnC family transcriptional regulator [archaeon]